MLSPKRRTYCLAAILFVIAIGFGTWLNLPTTRYQSYMGQYEKIYLEKGPVDVMVIGTSATQTVMEPELLAKLLKQQLGREVVIYDFSKSWRGDDFTYVALRDFFKQGRNAKQILIEYRWNGGDSHDHFYRVSRFDDIIQGAIHKDGYPWTFRLQDVFALTVAKASFYLSTLLLGDWVDMPTGPVRDAATSATRPNDAVSSHLVTDEINLHAEEYKTAPDRVWDWQSDIEGRNRYLHRKIMKMAKDAGAEITFFELPLIYRTPMDAKMVKDISKLYGVPLITKSRKQMEVIFPKGYTDHGHYTDFGRQKYMEWFAQYLAPKLRKYE